jgi:hypothetical protein
MPPVILDAVPHWVPLRGPVEISLPNSDFASPVFEIDMRNAALIRKFVMAVKKSNVSVSASCTAWVPLPGEELTLDTHHHPEWHPLVSLNVPVTSHAQVVPTESISFLACAVCDARALAHCENTSQLSLLLGPVDEAIFEGLENAGDEVFGSLLVCPISSSAVMLAQLEAWRRLFSRK